MPPSLDELNGLFSRARDEWNKAEEVLKAGEQICGQTIVPSIKELRYAGRRFVDTHVEFANGLDLEKAKEYINDGIYNCYCAQHDAVDVATAVVASTLAICARKIGYEHILKVFPDFHHIHETLTDVQVKIRVSRADRTNRDAIYDTITAIDLPKMALQYSRFLAAEPIMKSLAAKERRGNLFKNVLTVLALFVAGVAAAAAIYNANQASRANRRADAAEARAVTAANNPSTGAKPGAQAPHR